jgi:CRP-like cAMP-binding protein
LTQTDFRNKEGYETALLEREALMVEDIGFYNIALEESYEDGDIIIEEGKSGDWVCVVLEGSVEVFKTVEGRKFILGKLGRGEIFGELALLGAVKRTATVRAIGETTIGVIDREFLDKELNKMSSELRTIVVGAAQRFKKVIDRIQGFNS